jgi:hypothetical protein
LPDVSSITPQKRPCRRPPATLHGVVFDIFGWEPKRRDVAARILLEAAYANEAFAVAKVARPKRFELLTPKPRPLTRTAGPLRREPGEPVKPEGVGRRALWVERQVRHHRADGAHELGTVTRTG